MTTKTKHTKNNQGVSLAELSIVMVVIGLLLTAVVGGLSIRKSAEMRGFMTEISSFQIAIEGFDSKYSDLPGDMSDAYTYWTSSCAASASLCNGDSDSRIEVGPGDDIAANETSITLDTDAETFRAWQHLTLSGFQGGGFTGVAGTGNIQADIGINIPESKRIKVGYSISYDNTGDGNRNEINLGAFYGTHLNTNSALTPSEAFAIDSKMDDGIPETGAVHGIDGNDATAEDCVTGSGSSSTYTITVKTFSCRQTFPAKS